jgi:hypothetical protein
MKMSGSSLLATCRYSDIVPQPSRSASRAIDNPAGQRIVAGHDRSA